MKKIIKDNRKKTKDVHTLEQDKKDDFKLTKNTRFFLYVLGGILCLVSAILLFVNIRPHTRTEEVVVNSYNITTGASYRVHLKENNVFEEEFLEEGRVYPSAITDFINIDFRSELAMTNALSISGDYIIRAVLEGYQTGKDEEKVPVYEKIYPIIEGRVIESVTSSASINESLSIDRAAYRNYAQEIENALGGETGKDFYVELSGKYIVDGEEKPFSYRIDIPINNDKFYEIRKAEPVEDSGDIKESNLVNVMPAFSSYAIFILLLFVSVGILVFVRFFTANMEGKELEQKKLSELMRKYGSRMVCIENLPDISQKSEIRVKSITDLIELADEIREPVLYIEGEKELPKDGKIYILSKDYIYFFESNV